MMKTIDSLANPYVQKLYKLREKKYRDQECQFLIEGDHLIKEAKKANRLEAVLITDEKQAIDGIENYLVNPLIINKLSQTKSPSSIIGVCSYFEQPELKGKRFLLLDNLQDPGNVGTLVRSALGFGIDLVIMSLQSVDIYNDKFIRSTQGAFFHIPVLRTDLKTAVFDLKKYGTTIIGTTMRQATSLYDFVAPQKWALLLGSEGSGINDDLWPFVDETIFIPMNKTLESLNVAIAGSIILANLNQ
ncbi:MAG: TrmH family RNA methyltransferase [Bacilli bacterium]